MSVSFLVVDNADETALKTPVECEERTSLVPASAVIPALLVDMIGAVATTLLVGFFGSARGACWVWG